MATPGGERRSPRLPRRIARAAAAAVEPRAGDRIVVAGDDGGALGALLAREPGVELTYVVADESDAAELRSTVGAAVVTAPRPGRELVEASTAVVLIPSGYEGADALEATVHELAAGLPPESRVVVVTHRRRGERRLDAALREAFNVVELRDRGGGGYAVLQAAAPRRNDPGKRPGDQIVEDIGGREFRFATGPGLFSRTRIDLGSRLLLSVVTPVRARSVLDLGCGYGVLGIAYAAGHPDSRVVLLDVDARATEAAERNRRINGVEGNTSVVLADGPGGLGRRSFDLIMSHFPIHIPSRAQHRLVQQSAAVLAPTGRMVVVAFAEYDLHGLLASAFEHVEPQAETAADDGADGFVVLAGSGPRVASGRDGG